MGKRNRAAVVVLGDFGRSPRMQYHTLSLASQAELEVDVIAYADMRAYGALDREDKHAPQRIKIIVVFTKNSCTSQEKRWERTSSRSDWKPKSTSSLDEFTAPSRAATNLILDSSTSKTSCTDMHPCLHYVVPNSSSRLFPCSISFRCICQNPPSIPTFTVVKWACWLRKATFIIDWHNFGYTLLGMSLGARHPLVKTYAWYEKKFGKSANGHICVTKAMQQELQENWDIQATVLYDRSPGHFHATSVEEKHKLFRRLGLHGDVESKSQFGLMELVTADDRQESTLFSTTLKADLDHRANSNLKKIVLKDNRPALIISSTSWTADEDFGMLLEAAVCYDRRVSALLGEEDGCDLHAFNSPFPPLFIIVTGKGPLREEYERRIQKLRLRRVAFQTMWVSSRDYPLLLGSADLGVCLHTSSSGLDLPMKVVDMFGCGLPVCAVSYSCINELVKDGENGLLFESSSQLANQFLDLFKGFPHECKLLNNLRNEAVASGSSSRWNDEWSSNVLPLIKKLV